MITKGLGRGPLGRRRKPLIVKELVDAEGGIEPPIRLLQSRALPLGYSAKRGREGVHPRALGIMPVPAQGQAHL